MKSRLHTRPNPDPAALLTPRMAELRAQLEGADPGNRTPHVLAALTGSEFGKPTLGGRPHDSQEFRLHLWGKPVSLTYPGFIALDPATRQELRPDQQTLLLYYFSTADGAAETGQWISFADLPGGRFYNQAFQGYTGHELVKAFGPDRAAFERAATSLDGRPYPLGDAAFVFRALPRLALLIIFWQGDCGEDTGGEDTVDFPPSYQILFDASASHYLPTDAFAILGSTLTRWLIACRVD